MHSNFLQACILKPTRIVTNNKPSIVDSIFINTFDKKIDSGNIIDKVSYHMSNFFLVKYITDTKKYQKAKIRNMKNFNKEKYLKELEEINTRLFFQCNNVNDTFETFQSAFLSIIDDNALIITLSQKESKLRQKAWLTKDILESIRTENQLYKNTLKSKIISGFKDKSCRNKINMLISKSKRNYIRKFFEEV